MNAGWNFEFQVPTYDAWNQVTDLNRIRCKPWTVFQPKKGGLTNAGNLVGQNQSRHTVYQPIKLTSQIYSDLKIYSFFHYVFWYT